MHPGHNTQRFGHQHEIVDPDVDLHDRVQRAETPHQRPPILAAIATGGVVGAEARYGLGELMPAHGTQFPWGTLMINVSGCLLIGVLMSLLLGMTQPPHLARGFLSVGLLGGYTTFSTFAVEADRLLRMHRPLLALAYVLISVSLCLIAVTVATVATRAAHRGRNPRRSRAQVPR